MGLYICILENIAIRFIGVENISTLIRGHAKILGVIGGNNVH